MTPQIRKANQEFLEETADTFLVTIPPSITAAGQQFIAQTPQGERFLVTCPPNPQGGQRLRIHAPHHGDEDQALISSASASNDGSTSMSSSSY